MHFSPLLPLLSLLPTLLLAAPANDVLLEKRGGSITYERCTASEETLLKYFLKDMVKLAAAGAKASEMPAGSETDAYKAWWGAQKDLPARSLTNERLNSRFEKLQAFMTNPRRDVIFNCVGERTNGCTGTSPAATDRRAARIHLCTGSFWVMPMRSLAGIGNPSRDCTGVDLYRGQAAVLLHELTHALFRTNDEEQPGKGKGSGYGHLNCLDLAKYSIAAARENADQYAMFATAAYFGGVGEWPTKGSQICSGR